MSNRPNQNSCFAAEPTEIPCVKTIVTSYFWDLRIWTPENRLAARGSDEAVIVRDALNESKIMVKDENQAPGDGQALGKENDDAVSAIDSASAG